MLSVWIRPNIAANAKNPGVAEIMRSRSTEPIVTYLSLPYLDLGNAKDKQFQKSKLVMPGY